LADKVSDEEKQKAEAAKEAVKKAIEGNDIDDIKAKTEELTSIVQQLSVKLYEQMAQQSNADGGAGTSGHTEGPSNKDKVFDADYEVVDDKDK
jgi:molecular chaperone DnaK